ncbi:hypothetical protein Tco_0167446 [Tanacetum coccineum]
MNTPYPPSEQKVKNSIIFADMAPLPPREQRHPFLRYEGLEYTDADIADFEERLERIYSREIHRGPLVRELILEFLSTLRFGEVLLDLDVPGLHTGEEMESPSFARYWIESKRMIPGKGDLHDYWRSIFTDGDFLGPPLSYTLIRDLVLRLCHRMMAYSIDGRSLAPEKSGAHIFGGQFIARLAEIFGILTAKILRGLTVIALELLIINMGPERQPDAAAGAPGVAQDALIIDEGVQANPAPIQEPPL